LLLLLALGVAGGTPATLSSASAAPRPAAISCRVIGAFQPALSCRVGVTIVVAPNPSTAAAPILIGGQVLAAPVPTTVVLWQRLGMQRRFHAVTHAQTNGIGQYLLARGPGVVEINSTWYVTTRDRLTGRELRSPTLAQQVSALVTLSSSATKVSPGELVTLAGNVTPSHAGQQVLLEQNTGGTWQVIAQPRLNGASDYVAAQQFGYEGVVYLRVVLPADRRNILSYSPVVTITVTGSTRSRTT
jgi:hypothetical protein